MSAFVKFAVYWDEAKGRIKSFLGAESGATAMEYALIAAGIAVAIIASVAFYADNVSEMFIGVAAEVTE